MKKKILLIILSVLIIAGLTACSIFGKGCWGNNRIHSNNNCCRRINNRKYNRERNSKIRIYSKKKWWFGHNRKTRWAKISRSDHNEKSNYNAAANHYRKADYNEESYAHSKADNYQESHNNGSTVLVRWRRHTSFLWSRSDWMGKQLWWSRKKGISLCRRKWKFGKLSDKRMS